MTSPTGEQYEISHGPYRAVITEQGATLRELTCAGRPLVTSFGTDGSPAGCQGQQLLPWPNRIRDGRWTHDGVEQQLALTEPDRHNALHGLACWVPWLLVSQDASSVTQRVVIHPQPGWPGTVEATITHALGDDGLTVELTARNIGAGSLPFGYAAHPYLTAGGPVPDTVVVVPAARYLQVEPDRLLPIALAPVDGRPEDLRADVVQGDRSLDTAYTDLDRTEGRWEATVSHAGSTVTVWGDDSFGWVQVYNQAADGVAVEPMTCGPDAFNPGPTHDGVITLAPGAEYRGIWGLQADWATNS